jgi:hypothetical protein
MFRASSGEWYKTDNACGVQLMSRSKIKVLVVFFDWKGIVHHGFVPRGQMVNKQLY